MHCFKFVAVDHFNCSNCEAIVTGGIGITGGRLLHGLWKFISVWVPKKCHTQIDTRSYLEIVIHDIQKHKYVANHA